jgi:hypothetical protein
LGASVSARAFFSFLSRRNDHCTERAAMRTKAIAAACAALILGGCVGDGCGPSLGPINVLGNWDDDCKAAGGTCSTSLGCGPGMHEAEGNSCILASCCFPGERCADLGGACVFGGCGIMPSKPGYCATGEMCCPVTDANDSPPDDAPAEVSSSQGTCDGLACAAGCACAPERDSGPHGVCECAPADAGPDAPTDADTDAPGDASPDAPTDAAADASEMCGVITCRGGCVCADPSTSACVCP